MEFKTFKNPPYNGEWCNVIVQIKRNSDGEIKESLETTCYCDVSKGPHTFFYSEGNFGCDCNRGRIFDDTDSTCGGGKYRLRLLHPETREVYYFDDSWPIDGVAS